jgi:hypothetical protein
MSGEFECADKSGELRPPINTRGGTEAAATGGRGWCVAVDVVVFVSILFAMASINIFGEKVS